MSSVISFSMTFPGPIAPVSSPPWPASMTTARGAGTGGGSGSGSAGSRRGRAARRGLRAGDLEDEPVRRLQRIGVDREPGLAEDDRRRVACDVDARDEGIVEGAVGGGGNDRPLERDGEAVARDRGLVIDGRALPEDELRHLRQMHERDVDRRRAGGSGSGADAPARAVVLGGYPGGGQERLLEELPGGVERAGKSPRRMGEHDDAVVERDGRDPVGGDDAVAGDLDGERGAGLGLRASPEPGREIGDRKEASGLGRGDRKGLRGCHDRDGRRVGRGDRQEPRGEEWNEEHAAL